MKELKIFPANVSAEGIGRFRKKNKIYGFREKISYIW